jgi:hypothetical protein
VAENQPTNKNRVNIELSNFAARLRALISNWKSAADNRQFSTLALELFALQFKYNAAYRKICEAHLLRQRTAKAAHLTSEMVEHWTQIPAVPTTAFKELELTCLPPDERVVVFHSSGTTEHNPSRHFHSAESLKTYEASLWPWFAQNVLRSADGPSACSENAIASASSRGQAVRAPFAMICLTPPQTMAPHSSLVHMFETVRQKLGAAETVFVGKIAADGSWIVNFDTVFAALSPGRQTPDPRYHLLLGTAFSFVHLLDFLEEKNLRFDLPAGSRVMETGGYKNHSRSMPKADLHALITGRLGIRPENIVCEYGMSELSSQAYDSASHHPSSIIHHRVFRFPPWARVQIISPETGWEVADGETGLIRVFDLANVFSVMAIQTEDLGVRHGDGFELIGRVALTEARGCSLMTA